MDRLSQQPPRWQVWLHYELYLVLVAYVVSVVVYPALQEETFGYKDGYLRDFAGILVMAKAMWSGEPKRPDGAPPGYDLDSHLAVTRHWIGRPIDKAAPFPYSPTMLYLLGPLCPLPMQSAFAVWSLLMLGAVFWLIHHKHCPLLLGPLVFLTPTAFDCFKLGQSALFAVAAIVYLGQDALRKPGERGGNVWLAGLVLWALTARPQLALTAGIALLATRHWRPVLIGAALTILTTAALTPWLGTRWVMDYLTLIGHYDVEMIPSAFAWALVPQYMNNLRALLTAVFGMRDDWSSKISTLVWLLSLASVLTSAWLRRVPASLVWGTCILLQLLLCPHVNSYEMVLLYAVVVFFLHVDLLSADVRRKAVWIIPFILWMTVPGEPFEAVRRSLLICGLVAVIGMFGWLYIAAIWHTGERCDPRRQCSAP